MRTAAEWRNAPLVRAHPDLYEVVLSDMEVLEKQVRVLGQLAEDTTMVNARLRATLEKVRAAVREG